MTHILINFAPLKAGGGQNVALNFLHSLHRQDLAGVKLSFLVAHRSEIARFAQENSLNVLAVLPRNPVQRMIKEFFYVNSLIRKSHVDIVYSYFGVGLFSKDIPQITGSADSNLYFPEVDFWGHYNGGKRLVRWVVDKYRVWGVKRATAVVFENRSMEFSARRIFGLKHTKFIYPSVNFDLEHEAYEMPFTKKKGQLVGLFLCGWQLNKNIMLIPDLAKVFKDRGIDFKFVLSASDDGSDMCKKFKADVQACQVQDRVYIVGPVKKTKLSSLYEQINYVFLLSLLESFSNNIIEAWYFRRPLIIADEPWARSICGDACCYVNRDDVNDIADSIEAIERMGDIDILIANGSKKLREFPTIDVRTKQELDYVKSFAKTN